MPSNKTAKKTDPESVQRSLRNLRIISYSAIMIGILALISSLMTVLILIPGISSVLNSHQAAQSAPQPTSLGSTIAGIDTPLNSSSLAIINNAPNAYFEQAGEMYLNGSLTDSVFSNTNKVSPFTTNGKTTVIYLGSITCVFCGENRWAMALALSRFGSFSELFTGYSALGDSDVPTLYWTSLNYNGSSDAIGNHYSSNLVNFLSIEDTHPITGGFALNSMPQILANIKATGNATYIQTFNYIINLSANKTTAFQGTPYSLWGKYLFSGADAAIFGNTSSVGASLPLTYMTHAQVLAQLANSSDQFAKGEYAAADIYVAAICKSMNNTASVCSLPSIVSIEAALFK